MANKEEDENFLSKAFKIISDELPKFFTETNTPFLGKDEEKGVMRESSSGQQEKEILEGLLTAGVMAPFGGKALGTLTKTATANPRITSALAAFGLQDPTILLSGPVGVADAVSGITGGGGAIKNSEASIVPAHATHTTEETFKAMKRLLKGESPKLIFEDTKKSREIGGLYQGPLDKAWRSEISDRYAALTGIKEGKFFDVLDHTRLQKAVPELADTKVRMITEKEIEDAAKKGFKMHGGFDPKTNTISYVDNKDYKNTVATLLHEGQHKIQTDNNWIAGSSPSRSVKHPEVRAVTERLMQGVPENAPEELLDRLIQRVKMEIYTRTAGEAEARYVQNEYLKGGKGEMSFPLDKYDVDVKQLLYPAK